MFQLIKLVKRTKRIGRGYGSGKGGHTVGKGQKGQKSRGKGKPGILHEGGNVPLHRKIPVLRGYRNKPVTEYTEIKIDDLVKRLKEENIKTKVITPKLLLKLGYKPSKDGFKVIGRLSKKIKLKFRNVKITKGVKESISE